MELAHLPSLRSFELPLADWREYFEGLDNGGARLVARVTLGANASNGADVAGARTLHAIRYDAGAHGIEIHVGHPPPQRAFLHYFVAAPHSILVQELTGAKLIEVTDAGGARTQIHVCSAPLAPAR
jgi:hypothetical protein